MTPDLSPEQIASRAGSVPKDSIEFVALTHDIEEALREAKREAFGEALRTLRMHDCIKSKCQSEDDCSANKYAEIRALKDSLVETVSS